MVGSQAFCSSISHIMSRVIFTGVLVVYFLARTLFTKRRVIGHQMASAFFAVLALTRWRLFIHAKMAGPDTIGIYVPCGLRQTRPRSP